MKTLFFGDSITAGENNNDTSFVDYVKGTTYNLGVSGTTIGEYSIYPVDGNSLLSQIKKHKALIEKADYIYLEYGINDVSAIMCGFTTEQSVLISFVKALDWIKQINPEATIKFLTLSKRYDIIELFAKSQCTYLSSEYFKGYNFKFPVKVWAKLYIDIMSKLSNNIYMIEMFESIDWEEEIDKKDGLHPNNEGYKHIALNI